MCPEPTTEKYGEVSVPLEGEYEPSPEYPPYVGYQRSTQREIPVFVLKPATSISR